ncbi:hypothetical protein N7456_003141 [Penicillium angulare]|uniref:Uncharacterized protein n=1 Tax=Penicillium angulare TaxID=116970 RepID=A0A9W9FU25_9EURO|nr:hypothetical protein N7456_003141 [Penicillium angulare]
MARGKCGPPTFAKREFLKLSSPPPPRTQRPTADTNENSQPVRALKPVYMHSRRLREHDELTFPFFLAFSADVGHSKTPDSPPIANLESR